jgi:aromatic ring-cleaving dioxygenase
MALSKDGLEGKVMVSSRFRSNEVSQVVPWLVSKRREDSHSVIEEPRDGFLA